MNFQRINLISFDCIIIVIFPNKKINKWWTLVVLTTKTTTKHQVKIWAIKSLWRPNNNSNNNSNNSSCRGRRRMLQFRPADEFVAAGSQLQFRLTQTSSSKQKLLLLLLLFLHRLSSSNYFIIGPNNSIKTAPKLHSKSSGIRNSNRFPPRTALKSNGIWNSMKTAPKLYSKSSGIRNSNRFPLRTALKIQWNTKFEHFSTQNCPG